MNIFKGDVLRHVLFYYEYNPGIGPVDIIFLYPTKHITMHLFLYDTYYLYGMIYQSMVE